MQVKEVEIKYGRSDEFTIYPIGDEHIGTKHCAIAKLEKQVEKIKNDPKAMWVGMGDKAEFITPNDPRWDGGVIADYVNKDDVAKSQVDKWLSVYKPIANKCIGLLEGNHEVSIHHHSNNDVHKWCCEGLGVDDLGYACFIKFIFKRGTEHHVYKGVFTHGNGGAITGGSKVIRLIRFMQSFDADMFGTGHMHDIVTWSLPYLELNEGNQIREKVKVGAITGCWFTTYTQDVTASYGEIKGFPPTSIGCPCFKINPDKQQLRVEG